jgi:hypothetical protein
MGPETWDPPEALCRCFAMKQMLQSLFVLSKLFLHKSSAPLGSSCEAPSLGDIILPLSTCNSWPVLRLHRSNLQTRL